MNAGVLHTSREPEPQLASALADERASRWVIEPELLARTLHVDAWCSAEALNAAERELVRLHRTELAFLLREAASLRMRSTASRSIPDEDALPLDAWRACFREALRSAALDCLRVSPALYRLLLDCRAANPERWPAAVDLARAALALHDVEAGRARLAEALLVAGRGREARADHGASI
jgi:hypothetical protein